MFGGVEKQERSLPLFIFGFMRESRLCVSVCEAVWRNAGCGTDRAAFTAHGLCIY